PLEIPLVRMIYMGMFFAFVTVFGCLGLFFYFLLSKKYVAAFNFGSFFARVGICTAVALIAGILFQLVFMLKPSVSVKTTSKDADIVILMDCSGSMESISDARSTATADFLDDLGKDSRVMIVPFAATVFKDATSELLYMTDDNKDDLKDLTSSLLSFGTTEFEEPLELAYDTLEGEKRENCTQAVVIVSDMFGVIPEGIREKYEDSDIQVYNIRFDFGSVEDDLEDFVNEAKDFADETGGLDIPLDVKSDGSVDTEDMKKAFEKVFRATTKTQAKMDRAEGLLVFGLPLGDLSVLQVLSIVLSMVILSAIVSFALYGFKSLRSLLFSLAFGALAAAFVILSGILWGSEYLMYIGDELCYYIASDGCAFFTLVPLSLILGTSWTFVEIDNGGDQFYVP
ncbi:MAG: VWA domain-containing protein, partial [Clostridia bacterium]|nr:VWA domain-containing protein [Clostridia bacterium]